MGRKQTFYGLLMPGTLPELPGIIDSSPKPEAEGSNPREDVEAGIPGVETRQRLSHRGKRQGHS